MKLFKSELEKRISRKFDKIDTNIKSSFVNIKQDIKDMQDTIEKMRNFLKKEQRQNDYAKKQDNKIRSKFRKQVDDFEQKTKQLKLAFSKVEEIQNTLVTKKDLAQIEERIKQDIKSDIKDLEKKIKKQDKPRFSLFKKKKN